MDFESIKLISPLIVIFSTSLLVILLGTFSFLQQKVILPALSLLGVVLSWVSIIWVWNEGRVVFQSGLVVDNFGLLISALVSFAMFLVILMSQGYGEKRELETGEYYGLILMSGGAMMTMAMSTHLITLFVALETFSIGIYALSGISLNDTRSKEGALKYFILGSFASAFLLYGMALLYGSTGSLDISSPAYGVESFKTLNPLLLMGVALVTIGIAFKVGAVPFHWWVPDAYEGAPIPITGYMSTAVKMAAFAFGLRFFVHLFRIEWLQEIWRPVLWILAILTLLIGSVMALLQDNIKRLLAYSSIVHGGYLLIAMYVAGVNPGAAGEFSAASMVFYLAVYTFITLGTFGVVVALSEKDKDLENLSSYKGLGYRSPKLAIALAIFLFALAGIPPTAGFMGKFYIFKGAIENGSYLLGALGLLASIISLYYYLRVIVYMYMHEPEGALDSDLEPWGAKCALAISLALTVILGILPGAYFHLSQQSVAAFFR